MHTPLASACRGARPSASTQASANIAVRRMRVSFLAKPEMGPLGRKARKREGLLQLWLRSYGQDLFDLLRILRQQSGGGEAGDQAHPAILAGEDVLEDGERFLLLSGDEQAHRLPEGELGDVRRELA